MVVEPETEKFIHILQASITPAVLISGFGLLLLSMTNRLGRAIDRVRLLTQEKRKAPDQKRSSLQTQIDIMYSRCRLLQTAIALITLGIFFVSVTIFMLFATLILKVSLIPLLQISFAASLICLIFSIFLFVLDIRVTLRSLKIEITKNA